MHRFRTLAVAVLLVGAAALAALTGTIGSSHLVPPASAGSTFYSVDSGQVPIGCCDAGDAWHVVMWPPTPVGGLSAVQRCLNMGGQPWTQNFGNGYVYLWCLNIDF